MIQALAKHTLPVNSKVMAVCMLLSMLAQLHQCHAFPAPIGTQAFLGNQRIKEFPGNRRTEAFLGNQMIKDFQTEKDSNIMQSNIVQQLHNLSLSNFSKVISTKKIGEILLPKQLHSYSKVLEFTKIQEALDNLMLNILNLSLIHISEPTRPY